MHPLLLTLGEPAGIGPDCVLHAWQTHPGAFDNIIICAPHPWLADRARLRGMDIHLHEVGSPASWSRGKGLHCWNPLPARIPAGTVTVGATNTTTAAAVIHCIETAARTCLTGDAAGMITGPIEKAVLKQAGFGFPGHTEFLAHLAGDVPMVMMLASDQLRVALLTTHLAIKDVPSALGIPQTLQTLRIVHADLQRKFGIESPRIGLCALNPHAGEQGHFGLEEIEILAPAAEQARHEGIQVTPPLPSDTLFSIPMRGQFDAIVCCYHDQGLIPLKALSFGESVNVTLGLPFIRTSVDHGTALDRAGSDGVSSTSLLAAIGMARTMAAGKKGA